MSLEQRKASKKNKKQRRLIFRSVILAIMLGAIVYALVANFNKDKSIYDVGDEAPDFELKQINENNDLETIRLSDFRGKGVMLNFWATYCKPCETEMPYMEELYKEYKDKGIEIIAVNLDANEFVVDRFIDKYNLTFPVPYDQRDQVREKYRIIPLPSSFFIDPDGVIVRKVEESLSLDKLEGYLQEIQPK
ncbi:thiol-disulfide oxidoreductase ResA [Virgibacillus soli]